jgi:hypothetical protein
MITHDQSAECDKRARAHAAERSEARAAASNLAVKLEALHIMTVAELHAEHRRLFGEPSHSRNRSFLRKKLAYRIQEIEEGGTPQKARDRIEHLLGLPTSVRIGPRPALPELAADKPAPPTAGSGKRRDSRVPPPGTILRREYNGEEHLVTVVEEGFEYRGERFTSLSTLALRISGRVWNGFVFFDAALRDAGSRDAAPKAARSAAAPKPKQRA